MQTRAWRWVRLFGLVFAFGLLLFMFRHADPRQIWATITGMETRFLIPVIVGAIAMPLVRSVRLKYIMEPRHHVPSRRVFAVYNVGQLLNIMLPVLTGQVARVVLFSRTLGITKTFVTTAVLLEVLFDGLVLLVMVFGSSFLIVMPEWMVRGEVVILIGCVLLFGFFYWVLHRHHKNPHPPGWVRRHLPERQVREWENIKSSFLGGLHMLRSGRHLAAVVLLSILSWLAHALIVLFLLRAFSFEIPFWGAMVILIVNTVAIMIPVSPGNIGTFQLACIVGLSFFGIAKHESLVFSILLHAAEVGPVFVLGSIAAFSQHVRLREYDPERLRREQERIIDETLAVGEVASAAAPVPSGGVGALPGSAHKR